MTNFPKWQCPLIIAVLSITIGATESPMYDGQVNRRGEAAFWRSKEFRTEQLQDEASPLLIVGIDQRGRKHLVHLVPIDSSFKNAVHSVDYDTNNQMQLNRGKWRDGVRINRKTREDDSPTYEKLIQQIVDSMDTHRNFVEKFLFSDRLVSTNKNEFAELSRATERNFDQRNSKGHGINDARRMNRYTDAAEYWVEERDEQLRRYFDRVKEANKPYGGYQDRSTMIEHEPYGVSGEGQRQEKPHQTERSLPVADVERRRPNSFAKLMESTFGHQNDTPISAVSDTRSSIEPDFRIDRTEARLENLPEV